MRKFNNTIIATFLMVIMSIIVIGPSLALAQQTRTKKTDTKCSCGSTAKSATKPGKPGKHRHGKHRIPKKKPVAPAPKIVYLPAPAAPKSTPAPTAVKADFADMVVDAGSEGTEDGKLELSDKSVNPDNFGGFLNAHSSDGMEAWIQGKTLYVSSLKGGDGKVWITDKNGSVLDVVRVSGKLAAPNATDASLAHIASTLDSLWWWIVGGVVLAFLILLAILFCCFRQGRRMNEMIEISREMRDDAKDNRESLDVIRTSLGSIHNVVRNIDNNVVNHGELTYKDRTYRRVPGYHYQEAGHAEQIVIEDEDRTGL